MSAHLERLRERTASIKASTPAITQNCDLPQVNSMRNSFRLPSPSLKEYTLQNSILSTYVPQNSIWFPEERRNLSQLGLSLFRETAKKTTLRQLSRHVAQQWQEEKREKKRQATGTITSSFTRTFPAQMLTKCWRAKEESQVFKNDGDGIPQGCTCRAAPRLLSAGRSTHFAVLRFACLFL